MAEEKVKLFVSAGCAPCDQVQKMVQEGRFNLPDVDMIDVSTEEGFPYIEQLGLTKVPCAYKGTQLCQLLVDDETLYINCGDNPPKDATGEVH